MKEHLNRFNVLATRLAALGCALLCASCGSGDSAGDRNEAPVPGVEAVVARHGTLPLSQRLSGVVRATNQVGIYPEIGATVTEVLVRNGDTVQKNQPLVRLRDKEFRDRLTQATASYQIAVAQSKQADARLKEARSELDRIRSLADQRMVSDAQLESAETAAVLAEADLELARARVDQARANMAEQEENLAQTVVRAPVSGSVGNRNAEVGMLVDSGTQLFTLGQLDSVYVQVVITDRMLSYIEEGQPAEILSPNHSAAPIRSTLARISPFLHPVAHSTEGEIDLANPGGTLKPGMFVTVDIFHGVSEEATIVPLSALYENPATGVTGVYVAEEEIDLEQVVTRSDEPSMSFTNPVSFEFVPVTVVARGRMEAGIRGVDPGKWVITLGQHLLDGKISEARVRPVEWEWVEKLQNLQREDLMREMIEERKSSL